MSSLQHGFMHFNISLKIQIAVFGSVVFLIGTLLMAMHFADEQQDDFRKLLYKQQFSATEYVADSIGNAITVRGDSLLLIARAIKPEWVAKPQRLKKYLEQQQSIYRLLPAGLFVISLDGTILVDYPVIPGRQGRSVAQRDYFTVAVKTEKLALGKPFRAPSTARAVLTWGVPIKDEGNHVIAVLGASALIHQSDLFPEISPRDSRALGDIHVMSPEDRIVVVSTNKKLTLVSAEEPEVKALSEKFKDGWEGSEVLVDGSGTRYLVSGKREPRTGWVVISTLPTSTAFAPISDSIKDLYHDAAITALLVALVSWLFLRQRLNPLLATARAINEITSGQVPPHPLPELGSEEIRQLIRSFNRLQKRNDEQGMQLRASEERWKFAVEGSHDGVWDRNLVTGKVSYSKRYKEMYGFAEDELEDKEEAWYARVHPDDVAEVEASRKAYFAGDSDIYKSERRMQCKDGSWKWTLVRGMVVRRAEDGKPLRMIGTHTDISEQKRQEAELRMLATSDPLTGLPNRRHFLSRMDEELARLQRLDAQDVSLLMLDIDYFKRVNDTHGHSVGDAVLKHFAAILNEELRQIDSVGRLGGEEFAIILPGADPAAAETFAERLRRKVETSPLQMDALSVPVTVSIGIAAMRPNDTPTNNALARADEALYQAKSSGRNRVKISRG
jgi:diguanylate cyclase (GGDEF)-like protein/PAS domain S-box-containing protein